MSVPLVSICIPTFNNERHLAACLSSIQAQTVNDFEVIVLDDCSTDRTMEIAFDFANRDSRIRVLRNEFNRGAPGNWSQAVRHCKGTWIKFVFGDDGLAPNCLARLLEYVDVGIPFIFFRRAILEDAGDPGPAELVQYLRNHRDGIARLYPYSAVLFPRSMVEVTLGHFGENIIGEPTCVLVRRDAFDRFGFFDNRYPQLCDMECWARIVTNTGAIVIAEELCWFRVHGRSISSDNQGTDREAIHRAEMVLLTHAVVADSAYFNLRALAGEEGVRDLRRMETQLIDDFASGRARMPASPSLREALEQLMPRHV